MQTVDGDTGQVGSEVAEFLDVPHICFVESIDSYSEDEIVVMADVWDSIYKKKMRFPGLITVTKDINAPRLPSFKNKMAARKAEIPVWGLDTLSEYMNESSVGLKGSATWVKKIEVPKAVKREGKLWRENIDSALDELIEVFAESKVLEVK
jgi:electron transfer flavoprotein beta subunit